MALPAGRYGVTKNQLLKIKKLPMNTIKLIEELTEKFDLLGSAAFKNSTSVVTQSTDLVESKAVKNILGWGNKNLCNPETFIQALLNESGEATLENRWITSDYIPCSGIVTLSGYKDGSKVNFCVRFAEYNSSKTFIQITTNVNIQDVATWSRTFTLNENTRYVRMSVGFNNEATTPSDYFATNRLQLEVGSTATVYEPYHASVEETLRDAEVVEGKNKLPYPFYETGTKTESNISIINNGDGTLSIGTSAKTSARVLYGLTGIGATTRRPISEIQNKILVINATGNNFGLGIWYYNSSTYLSVEYINTNKKPTIPNNADSYVLFANVPSGTTPTGTIKPMIVDASETDYSYEPYYIPLKDVVPNKCDNSVIGTVEDGTTASQAYAVGQHFIRDGAFCTVTTAITSGESLVGSSKFTSGDVASELVTITSACTNIITGATANTNVIKKYGNVVYLTLALSGVSVSAWGDAIATIPSDYRPKEDRIIANCVADGNPCASIIYNSNGNIKIGTSISDKTIYITGAWIL